MTRIGDLVLEHAPPGGPPKPCPLLLVHGMNGGAWYLRPWLYAAAQAGGDSWALNLCGHHGSRPVPELGRVSVSDYVEDVEDCLRHFGQAVMIGHSMTIRRARSPLGSTRVPILSGGLRGAC